jgi:hypothetical protein
LRTFAGRGLHVCCVGHRTSLRTAALLHSLRVSVIDPRLRLKQLRGFDVCVFVLRTAMEHLPNEFTFHDLSALRFSLIYFGSVIAHDHR